LNILIYLILFAGLVIMIGPFLWMISTSFKTTNAVLQIPPQWIPDSPTANNYLRLFSEFNFYRPFINSVIVAVTTPVLSLLVCSMAGYAFAKFDFPFKRVLFLVVLGTLMVPTQITMIPVFLLLKRLAMLNTYRGLILPGVATAFNIFFLRQFMQSIPEELLEAARIDGAGEFFIFFKIVLPLTKPALAALGIFSFTGAWNQFLWPLIIATSEKMYTLPVAISNLTGQFSSAYGLQMAASVMATLPIIIIFLFAQKYFIRGITLSGLKG
jgi:multiple sugar transport system permease protein